MIFYTLFQLLFLALIYYFFGLHITLLSILMSVISFLFLETINYVEHYGLLRKKNLMEDMRELSPIILGIQIIQLEELYCMS